MKASAPLLRLLCVTLLLALALPHGIGTVGVAHAQQAGEQRQGGGLLRFLLRRNESTRQERIAPPQAAPRRTEQRRAAPARRATGGEAAAPAVQAVEKAEDAKRVLIVGDFLASGLADGLTTAFAENPDIVVVDAANGSSGLVRDDYYDWPGNIGQVIETHGPAVVVVMIGSNDRQQMRVGDTREQPRSEPWTAEYEKRATALAKAVRDRNLPLVWVGNLPFRPGAMSSDMIAFNDIYRRIVTDLDGEFVDVWDGFVDENGNFVANGPDMNGQPAQLRASDGINVTRQGRRKIAFYVEKPLNRLLDTGAGAPTLVRLPDGESHGPAMPGEGPAIIDRTAPMAIDDPELDGGGRLLGESVAPSTAEPRTPAERLAREGIAPDAHPGRADDFSLRRPVPASTSTPDPTGTSSLTP